MQVAQVKKCTFYRLLILKKIRNDLPLEIRIKFYDYHVKPLIEYCSSAWGVCSKENQSKIIKIQKKAARLILEAPPLTPSKHMFQELKWLPFEIVKFKQVNPVYKAVTGSAPQYIQTLFILILKITQNTPSDLQQITNYSFLEHITNHFPIQA